MFYVVLRLASLVIPLAYGCLEWNRVLCRQNGTVCTIYILCWLEKRMSQKKEKISHYVVS